MYENINDHEVFKKVIEMQDKALLQKANKIQLTEIQIDIRNNFTRKIQFDGAIEMHEGRLSEMESELEKFKQKVEDLKYSLMIEINNSVRRVK